MIHKVKPLIIFGASGHAHVVGDLAVSLGYEIACFVSKNKIFIKDDSNGKIFKQANLKNQFPPQDFLCAVGIGDNYIRSNLFQIFSEQGYYFPNLISNYSWISPSTTFGAGNIVMPGAVINVNTVLGNCNIVNTMASIDHGSKVGNYVHIAPKATICGNVKVFDYSLIGAGSTVLPELTINESATVGAGSCVVKNVKPGGIVKGIAAH